MVIRLNMVYEAGLASKKSKTKSLINPMYSDTVTSLPYLSEFLKKSVWLPDNVTMNGK